MSAAVKIVHGLHGQENRKIQLGLVFLDSQVQFQRLTPFDHAFQYLIDRVLIFTRPFRNAAANLFSGSMKKFGGRSDFLT